MPDKGKTRAGSHIYIGLRLRYIFLFSLTFLVLLAGLYVWFYNFGMPLILHRATTAFDIGAAVSNIMLDPATVSALRENFIRALQLQVWQNIDQAGLGVMLAVFLVSAGFISLVVSWANRNIAQLTAAARQIAQGNFDVDLSNIYNSRFQSEISELARAVEESGRAHLREQKLKVKLSELKIEINNLKRDQEVSAIVDTDTFQELKRKAAALRRESAEGDTRSE